MLSLSIRADASDGFVLYHYDPSLAAACTFIALFSLTTLVHVWQMLRTRTWFLIPFIIGGLFEIVGYVGRAISATQQSGEWTTAPYVLQTLLLLVAPALFAASIYMGLGRLVQLIDGDAHLLIRRKWMTKIFVAGDVISFFMQAAGGGLMASSKKDSTIDTGNKVIIAGLFVQIFSFGFFITAAFLFDRRMRKAPTATSAIHPWKKHMWALYIASILILDRSMFRVTEYLWGRDGFLLKNEVFLYIFDATLIFLMMVVVNVIHPGDIARRLKGSGASRGVEMTHSAV